MRIEPTESIVQGKVVVVTGALGALGKVVAETALARGARIAGIDHAPSQLPATTERIEIGSVDLSDPSQAKTAVETAAKHFGKLDALINIAGGFAFETVGEGDIKTWQRMHALNVLTALNTSHAALPHLAASKAGRIVNIGSMVADRTGFPGAAFYGMTKAAVASMTRGFAIDLAPRGITVNNIQPGPTKTDMNPADGPSADMLRSMIPLKRYGTADEVAGFVAYLAGSESGFVTGASLTIDGGLTI